MDLQIYDKPQPFATPGKFNNSATEHHDKYFF